MDGMPMINVSYDRHGRRYGIFMLCCIRHGYGRYKERYPDIQAVNYHMFFIMGKVFLKKVCLFFKVPAGESPAFGMGDIDMD